MGSVLLFRPFGAASSAIPFPRLTPWLYFFAALRLGARERLGRSFVPSLVDPGVEEALALGELLSGIDALYLKNSRSNGRISVDHNTDGFRRNLLFSGVGWLDRLQEFLLGDDVPSSIKTIWSSSRSATACLSPSL